MTPHERHLKRAAKHHEHLAKRSLNPIIQERLAAFANARRLRRIKRLHEKLEAANKAQLSLESKQIERRIDALEGAL